MSDHDDAWDELFDVLPKGWVVGRPPFDARAGTWRLYCNRRRVPKGKRDVTLVAEAVTEEAAVRQLALKLKQRRRR